MSTRIANRRPRLAPPKENRGSDGLSWIAIVWWAREGEDLVPVQVPVFGLPSEQWHWGCPGDLKPMDHQPETWGIELSMCSECDQVLVEPAARWGLSRPRIVFYEHRDIDHHGLYFLTPDAYVPHDTRGT